MKARLISMAVLAAVIACASMAEAGTRYTYKARSAAPAAPRVSVQYSAPGVAFSYGFHSSAGVAGGAGGIRYSYQQRTVGANASAGAGTYTCPNCGGQIDNLTGLHVSGPAHAPLFGSAYVDPSTGAVYPIDPQTGQVQKNANGTVRAVVPDAKPVGEEWKPEYGPGPAPNPVPQPGPPQPAAQIQPQVQTYAAQPVEPGFVKEKLRTR